MNKIESLVVALHSYQFASKDRARIDSDDIDHSVKIGATMFVTLPPVALVLVLLTVVAPQLGQDQVKVYIVITALVSVFGLSFLTDRAYDRNASHIKALADGILDDPEKGRNWARRKLAAVFLVQFGIVAALALLGRAYFVYGTDSPLFSI